MVKYIKMQTQYFRSSLIKTKQKGSLHMKGLCCLEYRSAPSYVYEYGWAANNLLHLYAWILTLSGFELIYTSLTLAKDMHFLGKLAKRKIVVPVGQRRSVSILIKASGFEAILWMVDRWLWNRRNSLLRCQQQKENGRVQNGCENNLEEVFGSHVSWAALCYSLKHPNSVRVQKRCYCFKELILWN